MKAIDIMKQSFRTAWNNKRLWLFGIFVAAASSSSGGNGEGIGASSNGGLGSGVGESLLAWLPVLLVAAVVVALLALTLNVISEAALIAGVERTRLEGDRTFGIREGLKRGLSHFGPVFGIKVVFTLLQALSVAVVAVPAVSAGLFGILPLWLGISVTVLLALPAIPWLLTLYFLRQYALRIAVLDGCGVIEALRGGWDYLHGRLAESLALLGVSLIGVLVSSLVMAVFVIPAVLLGGLVYFAAGLVPAIIAGMAVLIPGALCGLGFQGTYRSGVWTLGYLEATKATA